MSARTWNVASYAGAVVSIALAVLARWMLDPYLLGRVPYLTFFVAVAASAWFGGPGPGVVALGLGAAAVASLFLPPEFLRMHPDRADVVGLALFLGLGTMLVLMSRARWDAFRIAEVKAAESTRLLNIERAYRDQLEAGQRQLRAVYESSMDSILLVDDEGRYVEANPAACELFGTTRDAILGRSVVDFATPDFAFEPAWTAFLEAGRLRGEFRVVRPDGSWRDAEFSSTAGVLPGRHLSILRDVTDRNRAEARRRFLAEAGAVLASSIDHEETLSAVARMALPELADWCSFRIVEEDGTLRRHVLEHLDPGKRKMADELFCRYPQDPRSPYGAHEVARTGRPFWIDEITDEMLAGFAQDAEHLRMLRDLGFRSYLCVPLIGRGRTLGVLSMVMAESRRLYGPDDLSTAEELARLAANAIDNARLYLEAREALRLQDEGRALTESLLAASPMAVAFLDADLRYVRVNRELAEFNGVPAEEHLGRRFAEVVPSMAAVYEPALRRVVEDGQPIRDLAIDVEPPGRPGQLGHWLGTAYPSVAANGRVLGVGVILLDVTAIKQNEIRLREAIEAAEAANHAKNQFLAVLSHELRNPLNPILVGVTALLNDSRTPDSSRELLEIARRNVELEARLIDDLLDVTRIAQGKLRLDCENVNAHDMVRRAVETCHEEITSKALDLRIDLAAANHHVEADPARLQQIVWNLIKNASKFTPSGGRVAVRSRNQPGLDGEGPRLIIEVVDTGLGIEPQVLPTIFNAFEQGDPTITQRFGGLGLGLAISRSLTESQGGSLRAASDGRNQGATFTLELPTVEATYLEEATAGPLNGQAPPSNGALRILLVEDNRDTLRIMARLLGGRGHRVATASSVALALEVAAAGPVDLLISDIGLPDGNGLELINRLRELWPVRGIALSGFGMEDDLRKSEQAGFAAHLTKPIDFQKLEATIREVASSPIPK